MLGDGPDHGVRLSDGSTLGNLARGVVGGVLRDPVIGTLADDFNISQARRAQFEDAATRTTAGQVGGFIGEWGPSIAAGLGLYGVGRRLALEGAARLALGRTGHATATAIMEGTQGATGGWLARQSAMTAAKGLDMGLTGSQLTAASLKGFIPKPALMRAAEALGGNALGGMYEGAKEYARSGDPGEAARAWGIASALGLGAEGSLVLLGKAMGANLANSRLAMKAFEKDPEMQAWWKQYAEGLELEAREQGALVHDVGRYLPADDLSVILEAARAGSKSHSYPIPKQAPGVASRGPAVQAPRAPKVTPHTTREVFEERASIYTPTIRGKVKVGEETVEGRLGQATHTRPASIGVSPRPPEVGGPPVGTSEAILRRIAGLDTEYKAAERLMGSWNNAATMRAPSLTRRLLGKDRDDTLQQYMVKAVKSPETALRDMGPVGLKMLHVLTDAESAFEGTKGLTRRLLSNTERGAPGFFQRSSEALGVRKPKNGEFLTDHLDAYMRGGDDAVPVALREPLHDMQKAFADVEARRAAIGGPGGLDLAKTGKRGFWPLVPDYPHSGDELAIFQEKIAPVIAAERGIELEEARNVASKVASALKKGDFNAIHREVKAGYKELTEAGVPIVKDPITAAEQYLVMGEHRVAYGTRLGPNYELKSSLVDMVRRSGGNTALARSILENSTGTGEHFDPAMAGWLQGILNLQMGTKLTFSAIPNLFQSTATGLTNGFRNTIRGALEALQKSDDDSAMMASGLVNAMTTGAREGFLDPINASPFATFAKRMLSATGFLRVERWNRLIGGYAGRLTFIDDLGLAVQGRLRGNNLDRARLRMGQQGFDLGSLVDRVKGWDGAGAEEKLAGWLASPEGQAAQAKSMFNSAKLSQSIPLGTRKPLVWQHPVGRVLTQFKSFSFGHAKLMRDVVAQEAVNGNMKPAAYFLSLYPAVGEVVASTRAGLSGREREERGVERYFNNTLAMGGLGLLSDYYMATRNRRPLEFIAGPTVSDIAEMSLHMENGIVDGKWDGAARKVARIPLVNATYRLMGGGVGAAGAIGEYLQARGNGGEVTEYPRLAPNADREYQ
jgi:hypothetical protein